MHNLGVSAFLQVSRALNTNCVGSSKWAGCGETGEIKRVFLSSFFLPLGFKLILLVFSGVLVEKR